jgi:hypothetical protein
LTATTDIGGIVASCGSGSLRLIREALERGKRRDELRSFALSSTSNLAKVTGVNPWDVRDLNKQEPIQDPETGWFPWCPYLEQTAKYLDERPPGIAKPVKPVFIARDHFKSTTAAVSLALRALRNPEKSFCIFCDSEDKASIRLGWIADILKSDAIQWLFPEKVYPNDGKARFRYNNSEIRMRRGQLQSSSPTFKIFGLKTPTAGAHMNGVIWADDLVNEENCRNPEIQNNIWMKLQQVYQYVASPGCELWVSGTRYSKKDAYSNVLDDDSPLKNSVVDGRILMGDKDGGWDGTALNFFRFCVKPAEKNKPVVFHGHTFYPVRESLVEKRDSTVPVSEYYAQMENNPTAEGNCKFKEHQFRQIIPCDALQLRDWLANEKNVREHLLKGELKALVNLQGRVPLKVGILGDIAYADKPHSDFSWLFVIGADQNDDWYLMDGFRQKKSVEHGGLTTYFQKAFGFRAEYEVLPLAVELHAKESTGAVAVSIAENMGVRPPNWHPLKDNSIKNKEVRIADALETQAAAMKLFVCQDFPKDLLDELIEQAVTYPNGRHDDALDTLANARQLFPATRRKKTYSGQMFQARPLPSRIRRFM